MEINNFSKINLTVGLTREDAEKLNNGTDKNFINTIFETFDKNGNGKIDNDEGSAFEAAKKHTLNTDKKLANPDKINEINKKEKESEELLDKIAKFEQQRRDIEKSNKPEELKQINEEINKLNKSREKITNEMIYLENVKLPKNISSRDIKNNAQQYRENYNQQNPYYEKYMEIGKKMDMEKDPAKREQYKEQWRTLDKLVSNWSPDITEEKSNAQHSISASVKTKSSENKNSVSFNTSAETKLKNHNLSTSTNYTYASNDKDNSHSTNINGDLGDRIEVGNTDVNVNMSASQFKNKSAKFSSTQTTLNPNLQTSTNLGKFNINSNASFNYTKSSTDMSQMHEEDSTKMSNAAANLSYNGNIINGSAGFTIDHTNGAGSTFEVPLSATENLGKFSLTESATRSFGANTSSWRYGTEGSYNLNNQNIKLNIRGNFEYTDSNSNGTGYSFGGNARLTNIQYGYGAELNYQKSNYEYDRSWNISSGFSAKASDTTKISVGLGYGERDKAYFTAGVAVTLD